MNKIWSIRFLLLIAGLGGLLYGIDLGIIAGALPYLEATAVSQWNLGAQQLSFIVAAVALGTVLSCLFAGMLSDLFGRRTIMFVSGLLFVVSIPMIALASGYTPLLLGRLLQGVSGGLIGVVAPLYLAECLPASSRGKGTAIFQFWLTLGFVVAAFIGLYYAHMVDNGADMLSGGDSPAGLIGPRLYREVALPYEQQVITSLKSNYFQPVSLHICGNAMPILSDMASSRADVLELDHQVTINDACRTVGPEITIWGNLDPVSLLARGAPNQVRAATESLLTDMWSCGHQRYVVSSGCTLAMETPAANVRAMLDTVRKSLAVQ